MATVEQPQVTVRGIPQNQYNSNVAATTQDTADAGGQGGIEGHFKKHWVLYTLGIGAAGILVLLWINNNKSNQANGTQDVYGYGTGNTSVNGAASDNYGSQLDADYQQMINENNITNSLLQQLLNGTGTGSTTGGTSGSGSSSGSSGGSKGKGGGSKGKGSGSKGKGGTKSGGNTGGSSSGYHGSSSGGHTKTGKSTSSHSVGTRHSSGKTSININPHQGGAHGYVYTTKPGDTVSSLQQRAFPGSSWSKHPGQRATSDTNILRYSGNYKNLARQGYSLKKGKGGLGMDTKLKPGTKIVL